MARLIEKTKLLVRNGLLGAGVAALIAGAAQGQQAINSIEVLVNDEPISSFDINQRLRLVIAVAGGVESEQEFLKVREQVIRSMVDERLQLQEAKTVDLTIPDSDLEQFFARRAQGLNQTPEQLEAALRGIGSSKQTMVNQMEAEIAWSQLVQGRLGSFVSVSDEEVEAYIKRIYDNRGKFEYRLAEIVLIVDSPEQEASVRANAEELVERIKQGASFPDLAQQLSASSTAAVGGDLGWITAEDMDPTYADAIKALAVGDVSAPIRTPGGYVILAQRDRRRILTADPLDTQLTLRQVHLTAEQMQDADAVAKFRATVGNLHNQETSCGEVAQYAEDAGAEGRTEIGNLRLRDLQPEIRNVVQDAKVGKASDVMTMDDGMRVLFVCSRTEPTVQEPNFDAIYDQMEQQRLSMMGRRYLRDLRRDAIVDYR
ncbi:peptidylprolyl isomerase [Kordiimonas aestuarii]|uniref:peptidylprolyl isomerase n=1 Tax=Kordiimonas aestuarii TaxID=1005925 RepID=UPI0021D35249|nr:peptidylprolyl isomerase [Kordiimonas aestuarii]